jgi:hypothetical protein
VPLKADDVIAHLDRHKERLLKLAGEEVGGFVLIVPPDGEAIEFLPLNSQPTYEAFMVMVRDRIVASAAPPSPYGAVNMPRR